MSQLNENVLQRTATLSEFPHRPVAFDREPENLFAHIDA
jgi:hypothetical protein